MWGPPGVEIDFVDSKLHRLCCSRAELRRTYGQRSGDGIAHRLGQLASVECLDDLRCLLVRCRLLRRGRQPRIGVEVEPALDLVVEALQDGRPQEPRAVGDWKEATAITIIAIETRP